MSFTNIHFETNENNPEEEEHCPSERMGHICQVYANKFIIVWGGHRYDDSRNERFLSSTLIWVFNAEIEKWKSVECKDSPPLLSGSCSVLLGDDIFIFGGCKRAVYGAFADIHYNDLYRLNLKQLTWEKCPVKSGKLPSPRDKLAGWSSASDNRLYFFGGFGPTFETLFLDSFGDFDEISNYNRRLGWNNQLVYYDITTQLWHCPKYSCSKEAPKPRAAHTITKINDNQCILFGGRTRENRSNDLYVFNIKEFSWSKNLIHKESELQVNNESENHIESHTPNERSWHTMVQLQNDKLFLYGGLSKESESLGDGWLLDLHNFQWTKIETNFEKRLWHTAINANRDNQIYVFGGSLTDVYINQPVFPKHMLKITLTPESLKTKCLNFICSNLDLFENLIKKQIPIELEHSIGLRYLTSPKLDLSKDEKIYVSRSEYCSIS